MHFVFSGPLFYRFRQAILALALDAQQVILVEACATFPAGLKNLAAPTASACADLDWARECVSALLDSCFDGERMSARARAPLEAALEALCRADLALSRIRTGVTLSQAAERTAHAAEELQAVWRLLLPSQSWVDGLDANTVLASAVSLTAAYALRRLMAAVRAQVHPSLVADYLCG